METNIRWHSECLTCSFKGSESIDKYWADVEGNHHFTTHRSDTPPHQVILCKREVEHV